jgi:putative FmdB family regulatory protein
VPTYDYECAACGHRLEAFQTFSEATLTRCPKCNKNRLQRLIGPGAGILFKGSGFYQTDYKNTPSGGKDKAEPKTTPDKPAKDSPAEKGGGKDAGAAPKPAPTDTKKGPDKGGGKPA